MPKLTQEWGLPCACVYVAGGEIAVLRSDGLSFSCPCRSWVTVRAALNAANSTGADAPKAAPTIFAPAAVPCGRNCGLVESITLSSALAALHAPSCAGRCQTSALAARAWGRAAWGCSCWSGQPCRSPWWPGPGGQRYAQAPPIWRQSSSHWHVASRYGAGTARACMQSRHAAALAPPPLHPVPISARHMAAGCRPVHAVAFLWLSCSHVSDSTVLGD